MHLCDRKIAKYETKLVSKAFLYVFDYRIGLPAIGTFIIASLCFQAQLKLIPKASFLPSLLFILWILPLQRLHLIHLVLRLRYHEFPLSSLLFRLLCFP